MRRSFVSRALVLALVVGGAAAYGALPDSVPAASAAVDVPPPILLSDAGAEGPGVAVADDGTAHIAWWEDRDDGAVVVYCRLPRGATSCDRTEELASADFHDGPVGVVLRDDGTLYLLFNDIFTTFALVSTDGGDSFGAPKAVGTVVPESAVVGPGLNTLMTGYSGSAAPEGAGVQVMPTDDTQVTGYADLNDGLGRYYSGGVGLINETTPVTAYTDLTNTYVREYDATAGGDYNDVDNWLPSTTLSGENEPHVVTGPNGSFLMTHIEYDGNPLRDAYQVRRISPADGSLGDPFLASDISASLFGTLTADSEGGLTAVWTDDGDKADVRSSYAKDSDGFTPPGVVAENVRAYNLRVSTAGDAGGVVVWDDNNDQGKVYAAPIPVGGVVPDTDPPSEPPTSVGGFKPPKNTQKCTTSVTIKPGVVAAVQGGGCFDEAPKNVWTTSGDVNVNGIRFIGSKASTKVMIDTAKHTITATAGVVQSAGPLIFSKDAGTWDVDGRTTFEGLEKYGIKLFDFKALGQASVTFANGEAKVDVNLALPRPFDVVTGGTTLTTTTKKGLSLVGIKLGVPSLSVGVFEMRNLSVTYDASSSTFTGHVDLKLPPSGEFSTLTVGFKQGKLVRLALKYGGPPFPFTVYPGLWIKSAGFDYDGTDGFALGGGAELAVPTMDGPITFDAIGDPPGTGNGFRYAQPTNGPAKLRLGGTLAFFGFDLANAEAHFTPADAAFGFSANVDVGYPSLGVRGDVAGDVDLKNGTFYSEASLEACAFFCINAEGVISNVGIAACVKLDFFVTDIEMMVGYKWQGGLTSGSCDMGSFKEPASGTQPATDSVVVSSSGTIYTPYRAGVTTYTADIPGQGGVPQISVHDTVENETVSSDPAHPEEPQSSPHMALIPNPATNSVRLVLISEPSLAGNGYQVTALPGSVPVGAQKHASARREATSGITVAESYAPTDVTAKVTGSGRSRKVVWTATHLAEAGRILRFVETDASGLQHVLKETSDESGAMPFTVADGKAGKRSIEAVVVTSEGVAISSTPVATFTAPGYVLPAKASKLKLKLQKKGRLGVTWKGKRSRSWLVLVTVEDGRRLRLTTTRNAVAIPGVERKEKVAVSVVGVDAQGRRGKVTTAKR